MCCLMLNNEVGGKVRTAKQDSELVPSWIFIFKKSKQTSAHLRLHCSLSPDFKKKYNDCIIKSNMLSYPLRCDTYLWEAGTEFSADIMIRDIPETPTAIFLILIFILLTCPIVHFFSCKYILLHSLFL